MQLLTAPIYSNFSETIQGNKIINSFNKTDSFILKNEERVNKNEQARFASFCAYQWFSIRLQLISNLLLLSGSVYCGFVKPSSGFIGVVLVMVLYIKNFFYSFFTLIIDRTYYGKFKLVHWKDISLGTGHCFG